MKHYIILAACATFFGATINAFGIDTAENFEFTKKSSPHKAQTNIEEMNAIGKLKATFGQASQIVAEELKVNGIETGFMADQHEPSLEIVKQKMPEKFDQTTSQNQNLIELAYHYWKLKELFDSCMAVIKGRHFINFDPIEKAMQGALEDRKDRLLQYLFPDITSDKFQALFEISDEHYIQIDGNIILIDNYVDCEAVRVRGPFKISVSENQLIMYWGHVNRNILKSPNFDNQFYTYSNTFAKAANRNSFRTRYLDGKNTSNIASNNCFLGSLYAYYQKAKSDRLLGFDPLTKRIPHDIIGEQTKRQVKMNHQYLKMKYLQERLNDTIQKPIPIGGDVKCIEYSPEILNDERQKPKSARQNDLEKDHVRKHKSTRKTNVNNDDRQTDKTALEVMIKKDPVHKHKSTRKTNVDNDDRQTNKTALQVVDKKDPAHKHKSTRKTKVDKDDRQADKAALQVVDKKDPVHKHKSTRNTKVDKGDRQTDKTTLEVVVKEDRVHKHKSTRKTKVDNDENNNLMIVRQAEVEKNDSQKLISAPQAFLEFKGIEADAEMYALQNNKTKYELREFLTGVYSENYQQLEQLHLAFANLAELYHSAIFYKMEENKKYLEKIFSQEH